MAARRAVVWQPWAERGMWPFGVVVRDPLGQDATQVPFVQRDHPI